MAWRSHKMLDERSRNFADLEDWTPILKATDCAFVSLQYGDTTHDVATMAASTGTTVHVPPDLDLFNDLDGLAALSAALDLVIGFSNASSNIAGAVGTPLWLLTPPAPWTALGSDKYPWYSQAIRFSAEDFGDWSMVMNNVAKALNRS